MQTALSEIRLDKVQGYSLIFKTSLTSVFRLSIALSFFCLSPRPVYFCLPVFCDKDHVQNQSTDEFSGDETSEEHSDIETTASKGRSVKNK